jgi:hypothetical protein
MELMVLPAYFSNTPIHFSRLKYEGKQPFGFGYSEWLSEVPGTWKDLQVQLQARQRSFQLLSHHHQLCFIIT